MTLLLQWMCYSLSLLIDANAQILSAFGGQAPHRAPHLLALPVRGLIAFGDSLSDTGNAQALFPDGVPGGFPSGLPYGITWPGSSSTGRSSDGKLMVDYFVKALGLGEGAVAYLEDLRPDHRKSVNFAQAGATAAAASFQNPFHLMLQVKQFLQFRTRVISRAREIDQGTVKGCNNLLPAPSFFKKSLYFILVGGNDINHNLKPEFGNKSLEEIRDSIIPRAVAAVESAIKTLHRHGARNFLVFGRPPQGCTPLFKTLYGGKNPGGYDAGGCLIPYNNLTLTLQLGLRAATDRLRKQHRDSRFFFADLYNSFLHIKKNAERYGFTDTDNACCGSGSPYNFSPRRKCGSPGVPVCVDPSKFVSWDGNHFTQKYYKLVVNLILSGKFVDPPFNLRPKS
ncbi:GDSL esterase/lipase LIP-4 [Selaginella moellendorffii]|uniref:GDSL esterase/lipase LIP-4 n=1 Tax=Selaginella moellendorffii TaxID=88036 RepID=UPI000D1CEAAC|nr:GDSL esterase/lipase LIP-4 [Selaginella moellendorffii]|eukprot:XP_002960664.2 GDSL esterase/lipase LIP-4 [Selaginella moellendorffii]